MELKKYAVCGIDDEIGFCFFIEAENEEQGKQILKAIEKKYYDWQKAMEEALESGDPEEIAKWEGIEPEMVIADEVDLWEITEHTPTFGPELLGDEIMSDQEIIDAIVEKVFTTLMGHKTDEDTQIYYSKSDHTFGWVGWRDDDVEMTEENAKLLMKKEIAETLEIFPYIIVGSEKDNAEVYFAEPTPDNKDEYEDLLQDDEHITELKWFFD